MLSILSLLVILIVCYHVIQSFTLQVSSSAEKYIYNNEITDLQSEEKDYIKWFEFKANYEILDKTSKLDIKSHEKVNL